MINKYYLLDYFMLAGIYFIFSKMRIFLGYFQENSNAKFV